MNAKKQLIVYSSILCCALVFLGVAVFHVVRANKNYKEGQALYAVLQARAIEPGETARLDYSGLRIDHAKMEASSDGYIGWLNIPGTDISYPIVQGEDNAYYLHRAPDGSNLFAGSIFMDYRCAPDFSGTNTIIYGHHMKNDTMFGELDQFMDDDFRAEHTTVEVLMGTKVLKYRVFSVYQTDVRSDAFDTTLAQDDTWLAWIRRMQSRSLRDYGVYTNANSSVLTLATCTTIRKSERYVVQAVLTDELSLEDTQLVS